MQFTARVGRTISRYGGFSLLVCVTAVSASALPPTNQDPGALLRAGEPVSSISMANGIAGFKPLDDEHVMLSLGSDNYLLTLNRECHGLRWARHVGVTVSDNTIWAGFDALTADGAACPIREIHLMHDPEASTGSR